MKRLIYICFSLIMTCCSCEENSQGGMHSSGCPSLEGTFAWHSDDGTGDSRIFLCHTGSSSPVCISGTWKMRNPMFPEFSDNGKKLLFMAKEKGYWNIYSYDIESGSVPQCITSELSGDDRYPSWGSDGKTIVFEHNGQIWAIPENGEAKPVTYDIGTGHNHPAQSSDGNRYIFSTGDDSKSYIGIFNASEGTSKTLYNRNGADTYPHIDSQDRIFITSESNNRKQIHQGDINGASLKLLPFNTPEADYEDACAVDSDWLIASSNRSGSKGGYDLYAANMKDGSIHSLDSIIPCNTEHDESGATFTTHKPAIAVPEDGGYKPEESNGDNITSSTERPALKGKMIYHHYTSYDAMDSKMYVYDFAANENRCISTGWKNVQHPMNGHFSPDGQSVTFMGIGAGGTWDIFVYHFGDNAPVNLTLAGDYRDEDPKFSYDGKKIIFKRNDRISEINMDDKSIAVLSSFSGNGHHSMPYYTPDGTKAVCGCGSNGEDYIGLFDLNTLKMSVLYDVKGVVEYYPITIDSETFYYTQHVSETNRHDQLYKGWLNGSRSVKLKFNATNADYSDACTVSSGWLILCSTRAGSRGGYDLYIAHEDSGAIYSLSDYNTSINTSLNELGASYYSE
ncbi:MAG: PD40 domain-containing protein [Bacteroidales bacterium]|nr:PD40 domain-containing protein [Bacteroidales bacterium]